MLLDELAAQKKGKRCKKRDVVRFLMVQLLTFIFVSMIGGRGPPDLSPGAAIVTIPSL